MQSIRSHRPDDFHNIVEKHIQEPMDWFFNEWVYGRQIPHYDFNYNLRDAGGGKTTLKYSVKQSEVSDQFTMRVPVYVHVKGQPCRLGLSLSKAPEKSVGRFLSPCGQKR
jgi:aminopeptidase N